VRNRGDSRSPFVEGRRDSSSGQGSVVGGQVPGNDARSRRPPGRAGGTMFGAIGGFDVWDDGPRLGARKTS